MRFKRVYIAHPLSPSNPAPWNDRDANVDRYLAFVSYAMRQDLVVLTWIHHVWLWDAVRLYRIRESPAYYLERDAEYIKLCDELWECGSLEASAGMRFEHNVAVENRVAIRHDPEWDDFEYEPPCEKD